MNRFKTFALATVAAASLSLAAAPPAEARPRHLGVGLGVLAAGLIAVSYTHLDVYKRQSQSLAQVQLLRIRQ